MIQLSSGVEKTRRNVLGLQIWIVVEDGLDGLSGGEEFEHVNYTDTHTPNTRSAPALIGVDRDSLQQRGWSRPLGTL